MRPATQAKVPTWDLAVVIEGLSLAPFEPLESASEKFLTLKVSFLLKIKSLKRVGDLHTLSISPPCLEFAHGRMKAVLHPKLGYVPKVPCNVVRSTIVQAFHPLPHVSAEQETLHLLCPIQELEIYVQKSSCCRKSDQLLGVLWVGQEGIPGL